MHSNGVCHRCGISFTCEMFCRKGVKGLTPAWVCRGLSLHSICVVSREFESPNYLMVVVSDFESSTAQAQGYNEVSLPTRLHFLRACVTFPSSRHRVTLPLSPSPRRARQSMSQGVNANAFSAPELVKASVQENTLYSSKVELLRARDAMFRP